MWIASRLCLIDGEVEPRRQRDRPHHSHGIFAKADLGIADRSHDAGAQILESADVVDDRKRGDVVEQRVDREVAPERIFFGRAEGVVVVDQMVGRSLAAMPFRGRDAAESRISRQRCGFLLEDLVGRVRKWMMDRRRHSVLHDLLTGRDLSPERGDLDDLRAELDVRQAETPADDPAVAEQLLDLIGVRGGADVEVFRPAADQEIADAPADQIRRVVELTQPIENLQGVRVDVAAREHVLGTRNDPRVSHRRHCTKYVTNGC